MASWPEKGQSLVELTLVLVAIVTFALLTVTQFKVFSAATAEHHFSKSTRNK